MMICPCGRGSFVLRSRERNMPEKRSNNKVQYGDNLVLFLFKFSLTCRRLKIINGFACLICQMSIFPNFRNYNPYFEFFPD